LAPDKENKKVMNPYELQVGKLYVLDLSTEDEDGCSQETYDRCHGKIVIYLGVSEPEREAWQFDYNTWDFLFGEKVIQLVHASVIWNVLPASFIKTQARKDPEPC